MTTQQKRIALLVSIALTLLVGAYILWRFLGTKGDQEALGQGPETNRPPASGRTDYSSYKKTEDPTAHKGYDPEYEPVLVHSPDGRRRVEAIMKNIQTGQLEDANGKPIGESQIRANHSIGKGLYDMQNFDSEANGAIRKMLGYIPGVDPDNYGTYPIYGKYTAQGQLLRSELKRFLALDVDGLHLAEGRHEEGWFIEALGINLLMLTTMRRLPDQKTLDGNWATGLDREGLINFARINGFDKNHIPWFGKLKNRAKGLFVYDMYSPYIAYGSRTLAKKILAEMDRLDDKVRLKAIEVGVGNGKLIEQPLASSNPTDNKTSNKLTVF